MGTALLVTVLAATPIKLGSAPWQVLNVSQAEADYFLNYLTQQLASDSIAVTTPSEIAALLGMERQKELLGCNADSSSCIAELANALGVDGILQGSIGKFGERYELTLKIVNAKDASVRARFSGSAPKQEAVNALLQEAAAALQGELAPSRASASRSRLRWVGLAPALVGVAATIVGAFFWNASNVRVGQLNGLDAAVGSNPDSFADAARTERATGMSFAIIGPLLVVAGVVLLLSGLWSAP